MEKSQQKNVKTYQESLNEIYKLLHSFIKIANIQIPLHIHRRNKSMHIMAQFTDTTLEFNATSLKTMYSDCILFIEEMNSDYAKNKSYLN